VTDKELNLLTKICVETAVDQDYRACFSSIDQISNFLSLHLQSTLINFGIRTPTNYKFISGQNRPLEIFVKNKNGGNINIISVDNRMGYVVI
jgi:hypothetical protein